MKTRKEKANSLLGKIEMMYDDKRYPKYRKLINKLQAIVWGNK